MQRDRKFEVAVIVTIIITALLLVHHAYAYGFDFSKCPQECFVYSHGEDSPQFQGIKPNWSMNVIMPDGTCNISGFLLQKGNCSAPEIILTDENMTSFKNDVAIMTVIDIHTTHITQTQEYCQLAKFTWDHQDGYANKTAGLKRFVIPDYCNAIPIPEFSDVTIVVMMVSIITAIGITVVYKPK